MPEFPSTIEKVYIYNSSHVTRELLEYLYVAIVECCQNKIEIEKVHSIEYNRDNVLYIIINSAGFPYGPGAVYPKYFIIYQLEPLVDRECAFNPLYTRNESYLNFLRQSISVWDYNPGNVNELNRVGVNNCRYVPMGYNSTLSSPNILSGYEYSDSGRDFDVIFLGWANQYPRRVALLQALRDKGLNVGNWWNMLPDEMKNVMFRGKVVLNMHVLEECRLETVRLSITLANCSCIVSEESMDPELDNLYREGGVTFCTYDKLVETIFDLVQNETKRKELAEKSFRWYSKERYVNRINDFSELIQLPKIRPRE